MVTKLFYKNTVTQMSQTTNLEESLQKIATMNHRKVI